MGEWNHRVCERCWFDGTEWLVKTEDRTYDLREVEPLGLITEGEHAGAYRQPVEVVDVEPGACCVCGGMTITGIFARRQESELQCQGRHDPDQLHLWSRVKVGTDGHVNGQPPGECR